MAKKQQNQQQNEVLELAQALLEMGITSKEKLIMALKGSDKSPSLKEKIKSKIEESGLEVLQLEVIRSVANGNNYYVGYVAKGIVHSERRGKDIEFISDRVVLRQYAGNRLLGISTIALADIPVITELLSKFQGNK
jgi:hypothetical protein